MKTITVPTLSRTTPPEPMLEHAIRLRAHELYARRGMAEGHAVDDFVSGGVRASLWALATIRFEPEIKALKQINGR